jgi:hypothetical protein
MVLVSHLFACVWINIGTNEGGWVTLYVADLNQPLIDLDTPTILLYTEWDLWGEIYGQAFYFIL